LEMDVGDDVLGDPPPGADAGAHAWPLPRQLTGPTASDGSVSTELWNGGA
jgi:hypothetical protein